MSADQAYIWGYPAAAKYLGISKMSFWRMRNSTELTEQEKALIKPRILNGRCAFKKANLDLFMSPALNAPDAKPHCPFSHE